MKVIITGSTGMVGKGVLYESLENDLIEKVLVINRSSLGMNHEKLQEIILSDLSQIDTVKDQLQGYDACFFCLGISVLGLNEDQYTKITYDITKAFVDTLYESNPEMVFNYVSGTGTDSSEKGKTMWARVKGRTENMVLSKGFKDAYAFRPGMIIPEKGIRSRTGWYNAIYVIMRPFFPLFKKSNNVTTTTRIGDAMINSVTHSQELKHLENPEINLLAAK
ncbi:MAG: NAD-dependent epimerase/dehydratase family protein [bacterium]|nr:NAD-dependent epimerase/dehydratase family protein [bacterium]